MNTVVNDNININMDDFINDKYIFIIGKKIFHFKKKI